MIAPVRSDSERRLIHVSVDAQPVRAKLAAEGDWAAAVTGAGRGGAMSGRSTTVVSISGGAAVAATVSTTESTAGGGRTTTPETAGMESRADAVLTATGDSAVEPDGFSNHHEASPTTTNARPMKIGFDRDAVGVVPHHLQLPRDVGYQVSHLRQWVRSTNSPW